MILGEVALQLLPGRYIRAPEDEGLRMQDIRHSIGDRIHQLTSGRSDFGRTRPDRSGLCMTAVPNRFMGRVFTRVSAGGAGPVIR